MSVLLPNTKQISNSQLGKDGKYAQENTFHIEI